MNDLLYTATLSAGTTYSDSLQLDTSTERVKTVITTTNISGATITITPQISNNDSTWIDETAFTNITTNTTVQENVSNVLTYFRLKIVVTGGTVDIDTVSTQHTFDGADGTQATAGDVAHDAVDGGNPVKVGGYATDPTSLPTAVASGNRVNGAMSLQGERLSYLSRYLSGESTGRGTEGRLLTEGGFSYATISTATTTNVFSGAGNIRRIFVAGGTLGNVTIYDNIAGSGLPIQATATPVSGGVLIEDIDVGIGLTIVTAAATVLNIAYRN